MSKLGETVAVLTRRKVDEDNLGEAIYEWTSQNVEGVLVRPIQRDDIGDEERPNGIRVQYSLSFPKSYSGPPLEHARIALLDRGMAEDPNEALQVSGRPDILRPCPTKWNMIVKVGRVYG